MVAHKAVFVFELGLSAFLAEEFADFIVYYCLFGLEIVTTFVDFTVAFSADQNFKALIDFFGRHFPKVAETHVAVGLEHLLV